MLTAKIFELRDRGTLIPWVAMRLAYPMSAREQALWTRAGYGQDPGLSECTIQGPAHCPGDPATGEALGYNASHIRNARLRMAALWIKKNFDVLTSGQIIDIRVILGESPDPASTEV